MSKHSFDNINKSGKINVTFSPVLQRQKSDSKQVAERSTFALDHLRSAAAEISQPLDSNVSTPLAEQFGYDFSRVRVHRGPASAKAAEAIGARAYTLGNRIHLGESAHRLSQQDRKHLLAHEAVHTVQQGGQNVTPDASLQLSNASDAAEQEAEHIATSFSKQTRSPSLGLRDRFRATAVAPQTNSRVVAPIIQRDLTGKHPVTGGEFKMNLKTESHPGAKNGMSGTIKFKANDTAPDSTSIRLLQVVRTENLTTGKDYVWTGGEADRNKMMTSAAPGVQPGFFVDHSAAAASPRSKKADPAVSPYYRDYWPNAAASRDGSKKGKTIKEASLWDYPGWSRNMRFSFETVAKASDTNHVYGTVMWGFTISDASKGKVEKERAVGRNVTLLTTDKAIDKFNEFYKNPGASTAP